MPSHKLMCPSIRCFKGWIFANILYLESNVEWYDDVPTRSLVSCSIIKLFLHICVQALSPWLCFLRFVHTFQENFLLSPVFNICLWCREFSGGCSFAMSFSITNNYQLEGGIICRTFFRVIMTCYIRYSRYPNKNVISVMSWNCKKLCWNCKNHIFLIAAGMPKACWVVACSCALTKSSRIGMCMHIFDKTTQLIGHFATILIYTMHP